VEISSGLRAQDKEDYDEIVPVIVNLKGKITATIYRSDNVYF